MTVYRTLLLIPALFGCVSSSHASDDSGDFPGSIQQQYYAREAWRMSCEPLREPMPQRPMTAREAWSLLKEPTWLDDPDPSALEVAIPEFPETDYIDPRKGTLSDLLLKIKGALDLKRGVMFGIELPTEFLNGPDPSGIMPMPAIYEWGSQDYWNNRLGGHVILAEDYDDDKGIGNGNHGCIICKNTWNPHEFGNQAYIPYAFFDPSNDWVTEIWWKGNPCPGLL